MTRTWDKTSNGCCYVMCDVSALKSRFLEDRGELYSSRHVLYTVI